MLIFVILMVVDGLLVLVEREDVGGAKKTREEADLEI